jgi:NRPS condensation-like uncharacterized protein
MNKWYKLDNAAKIFPPVTNKSRTNVFRLAAVLKEVVDPATLEEAVNITIRRFPSIKVKMKRGIFWYYLEENNANSKVYPEAPYICGILPRKAHNGYLFKFSYFNKRISLEIFHSLTDGSGALEVLKSVVYHYLILKGNIINTENLVLTDEIENVFEEHQDSFLKNYDSRLKNNYRDIKAMKIKGSLYEDSYRSLIIGMIDVKKIKEVARKYGATITEFLTAASIYAASKVPQLLAKRNRPFQVFIPVNLRNYFPSKTLRNFSLFIASGSYLNDELTFTDYLEIVKADFFKELTKKKMQERIVANVTIEKNLLLRLVPLFIKEFVLRVGFNAWGDALNTITISNLGKVVLPRDMVKHVDRITFTNGASETSPINIAAISYNDLLEVSFSSTIKERDFQREFFKILTDMDIDVQIETNQLEVK